MHIQVVLRVLNFKKKYRKFGGESVGEMGRNWGQEKGERI